MRRARAPIAMAAVVAIAAAAAAPRRAAAEPSDGRLVLIGTALAIPEFFLGTTIHEGSHAVAAEILGAKVTLFRPWPGRDRMTGAFQLGLTRVTGLRGDGKHIFFYLAPKITDVVMLGGFLAWYESSAYPRGSYAQLFVMVAATGFWLDFTKDTFVFSRYNDLVKAMTLMGKRTEWQRLPIRLGFLAASAGLGYVVWRGHVRLFESNNGTTAAPALAIPVVSGRF